MKNRETQADAARLAAALPKAVLGSLWAVGGAVRDWALGRPTRDLDLAAEGDVEAAGRAIADALNGHFFLMHPATRTARVALEDGRWVDLVPLPYGLDSDLRRRDFTVNALAAPLGLFATALEAARPSAPNASRPDFVADPTGGWDDLQRGVVRMAGPRAFVEDPVRTMRGLRLTASLTTRAGAPFTLDPDTDAALRSAASLLSHASPERVRDEWMLLMDVRDGAAALRLAADAGALDTVAPAWRTMRGVTQNGYHHLDVWDHTLDVARQFDGLFHHGPDHAPHVPDDLRAAMGRYMDEWVTPPRSRRSLIRTAILLHDIGKPATRTEGEDGRVRFHGHEYTSAQVAREWAAKWRLSGRERGFLEAAVGLHMRPGGLVGERVTDRAIHRFFRDAGNAAPALLALNAADRLAARGPWTTEDDVRAQIEGSWALLRRWIRMKDNVALPLPISGRDLMAAFHLAPGPDVGRIIQELREIHADTPFPDRESALSAAAALQDEAG